ncbi:MAG TPA: sugar-transfer associated ATP-grasp domain-containing protein [Ferruginibacter sp.]|nr:sugar-transfer associated ATP-grasp domain-containing protein [Ferruginibacter sp.]HPH90289.1 sugar-transfer associated ATP-grasp domain-containing protein [Ferruginibacter sp.]
MIKKFLYLGYYIREMDKKKFRLFLSKAKEESGKSSFNIISDMIGCLFRYNISLLEYFQFRFYKLNSEERNLYAGTGYMYEYQLKMNPKAARPVLENKINFLSVNKEFVRHSHASLTELEANETLAQSLIDNPSGKLVFKHSFGQCGNGVEVVETNGLTSAAIIDRLKKTGNDYVEEFVVQHPVLMQLSPSGLNTVRIVTQINANDEVDIIAARLRITINSAVDNLAAGNMAAPIDIATGNINGPGVFSDITKEDLQEHPVTHTKLIGFSIPFWNETLEMIKKAAWKNRANRSVGWDVAITNQGPELIEGNHNWCKLLWQLPVHKGLKNDLEKYRL